MDVNRTARVVVEFGSAIDPETARRLERALEWLDVHVQIMDIGSTGQLEEDQLISELLNTGQMKLRLQLDRVNNLPDSEWLGEETVYQFLYYQRGYLRNVKTTMRRRIARALAVLAASSGVTVICSNCRKPVGVCTMYNRQGHKHYFEGYHPCEHSEPLVRHSEVGLLQGVALDDLYDINDPRTVETFQAYVGYLLSLYQ